MGLVRSRVGRRWLTLRSEMCAVSGAVNESSVDAEAAGGELVGEMIDGDRQVVAEDRSVLDDVGQLAHVAGPIVLLKFFHRFGRER